MTDVPWRNLPILVVGDVMLDETVDGVVERLCPEAPVPIIRARATKRIPGGAANAAANLAALGARPIVVGLTGCDEDSNELGKLIGAFGGNAQFVQDPSRVTTTKIRITSMNHLFIRIDRETTHEPAPAIVSALVDRVGKQLPNVKAVLISDYAKGAVHTCSQMLISAARALGLPVIVDPKGENFRARYRGATIIKPNQVELGTAMHGEFGVVDLEDDTKALAATRKLVQYLGGETAVLATRGHRAAYLAGPKAEAYKTITPTVRRVVDVTGAGDAVAAVLTAALAAGLPLTEAATYAIQAGSVVVGKPGTAVCTSAELLEACSQPFKQE